MVPNLLIHGVLLSTGKLSNVAVFKARAFDVKVVTFDGKFDNERDFRFVAVDFAVLFAHA